MDYNVIWKITPWNPQINKAEDYDIKTKKTINNSKRFILTKMTAFWSKAPPTWR